MKKIFSVLTVIVGFCVILSSCSNGPSKQELATANDSLMFVTLQQQNDIAELVTTMGDISSKLDEINGTIAIQGGEANPDLQAQRQHLLDRLNDVQMKIEAKQAELDDLNKKYAGVLSKNKELKKTIERMQSQISGYVTEIDGYKNKLAEKQAQIGELSENLTSTQDSLQTVSAENDMNTKIVSAQDKMLNIGYYVVASKKELKKMGLIKDGIFTAPKIATETFDASHFKEIDIREVTEIPLGSKDAKVLSSMPKSSYSLEREYDNTLKIVISDPVAFWSITRYLVVAN